MQDSGGVCLYASYNTGVPRPAPHNEGFAANRYPVRFAQDLQPGDKILWNGEFTTVRRVVVGETSVRVWHGFEGCKAYFWSAKHGETARVG